MQSDKGDKQMDIVDNCSVEEETTEELSLNLSVLNEEEKKVIICLYNVIKESQVEDYFEETARRLGMTYDEIMEKIASIKERESEIRSKKKYD